MEAERKITDLAAVKEIALDMLQWEIETTEYSPAIVRHPFTVGGLFIDSNGQMQNLIEDQSARKEWQATIIPIIEKADTLTRIELFIQKPYKLDFFRLCAPFLSRADFSKLLSEIWVMLENPCAAWGYGELLEMFEKADPAALMTAEEFSYLQELENPVTIFRGVTSDNPASVTGLSWTVDPNTATFFAGRFGRNGTVYEAQIDKTHIYAYFSGRGEAEIIVNPEKLLNVRRYEA